MNENSASVQNKFIADIIENKVSCDIFLVNGVKLGNCEITQQDETCLISLSSVKNSAPAPQLVFKRSIATIVPKNK